jgi:signal transduction histidine kinase/HAMP domain-containing protein
MHQRVVEIGMARLGRLLRVPRSSLAGRIIVGVVVLLLVVGAASFVTLRRMAEMQRQFQTAADVYLGLYGDLHEMRRLHVQQKMVFLEYLEDARQPRYVEAYGALGMDLARVLKNAQQRLDRGQTSVFGTTEADTIAALTETFQEIQTRCTLCVYKGKTALMNAALTDHELRLARRQFEAEVDGLMAALDLFQERVHGLAERGIEAGVKEHVHANRAARGLWAVALFTGLLLLFGVVVILAPLRQMVGVIERIGRGDYAQRLSTDGAGELGTLATAVNDMASAIRDRETALEAQAEAMDQARRRFEGVFQGITDLLSIQDPDLRIGEANLALARMSGMPRPELVGMTCFQALFGRDAPCSDCPARITFESGRATWMEQSDPVGGEIYEHHLYPIPDDEGRIVGIVEYTKVVTERRRLERQLEESRRLAALGQMTTSIAHEIRNPLSSIKMSLQILSQRQNMSGNDGRRLEIARREIANLEKLLREMLDFSRAAVRERAPVPLLELARATGALLDDLARQNGVDVRISGDEQVIVPGDRERLGRVLLNLCLNAVEAMRESSERCLRIEVERASTAREALLRVRDTGIGMDDTVRQQLFAPFYTTRAEGTGLGLAIAWKIIEAHRGRIDVTSRRGEGTTMTLILPLGDGA